MSDLPPRNLRNALKSIIPNWLADVPGLNVGFAFLFIIALMGDLFIEAMLEGVFAAWPGKGTPTALALVGQSRGFTRGEAETDASYAERLRGWLDVWPNAGSDEVLARLIHIYLGSNLKVRVVDRKGQFTTIDTDGTVSFTTDATWNWDATDIPERLTWCSDVWVIVYVTDGRWPTYYSLSDPAFISAFGHADGVGVGHEVPRAVPNDILSIISVFKGAHNWVEALVFTTDTAAFVPGSLGVTYPNGTWGFWSRYAGGVQSRARANDTAGGTVRYWIPVSGG